MDPKTLKKHSQIAQSRAKNIVILGAREKTSTGYRVSGHSSKGFETYYESLAPGTATDLVKHDKKDKAVRVLSGGGFAILDDGQSDAIDKRIYPGDELVFKAGTAYRLSTTSDQALEIHVTQDAKYDARLIVLEESTATAELSEDQLQEAVREPVNATRKGSKAKQQQAQTNGARVVSGQVIDPAGVAVGPGGQSKADGVATAAEVMNARPSLGRFDDVGAG